jgi:SAM-dependent methyltransferase
MLSEDLQNFRENMTQPWSLMYYRLVRAQLGEIIELKNLKILDFGSGFGWTANFLAKNNEVTAIEPNAEMISERDRENNYTQINGHIEKLKDFENGFFDVVVCHNVLEFVVRYESERAEIVKEFSRVLKPGGIMSIVKHNKAGRVVHKVVFENNVEEALSLLDGDETSNTFGKINYYNPEDLTKWGENLKIEKILGARILGQLQQNNDARHEPQWPDKMFELEMKICDLEPYKNIAFCSHVLLRKGGRI